MSNPAPPRQERVQVGLFLTNQHPVGTNLHEGLLEQLEMMRFVRDQGWHSVWGGQHFLAEGATMMQPAPFLARLAAERGDMTVGVGIMLLALHNPVEAAETVASLDAMCEGRFVFGVGLGYRAVEYNAFGISSGERVRRFEENLRITTALLRGESVTCDLPWCRLDEAATSTRPVSASGPPVWMAANNDAAVRRAARSADTWLINPHATVETVRRQLDDFRGEREDAGLPPVRELPAVKEIYCASSREAALERARPYLGEKYEMYARWGQDKALPGQESFDRPFHELEQDRFVIGTPDDCLRQLLPWRDQLGVDHFIFRGHWSGMPLEHAMSSLRLLADEVVPELTGVPA